MSFNRSGYIGRAPGDSAITISKQYFQPSGVTTDFTFSSGYDPGLIDVYRNGIKLINVLDYAATDGSTISLSTPVGVGSTVQVVAYKAYNIATVKATELDTTVTGTNINLTGDLDVASLGTFVDINVSGGATVGGTLVAGSFSGDGTGLTGVASTDYIITGTAATFNNKVFVGTAITMEPGTGGGINVTGVVTATTFYGDGSQLSNVSSTTINNNADNRLISGSGTANTLNGESNLTFDGSTLGVTGAITASGAVNVDATTDSTSTSTGALIVDGGLGVAKNVYIGAGLSVAGTLTYEDVTSVDSVGLITAKSGVNITGGELTVGSGITMGIAGVATFSGTSDVHLLDNVKLLAGDASDLQVYHDGSHSYVKDGGTGNLILAGTQVNILNSAANESMIRAAESGSVELYEANTKRFETSATGATISGEVTADGLIVGSGITFGSAGVATFSGTADVHLLDNVRLNVGDSSDLTIYHDGSTSNIVNTSGTLNVGVNNFVLQRQGLDETMLYAQANTSVWLYYDNVIKFNTTKFGSITAGVHTASHFFTAGVCTAASFSGDGSNLTNLPAAGIATEALITSGITTVLNLSKQDHKITASGICTITTAGGTEGESHTIRITNSGITTVGFSSYFQFAGGASPVLTKTDGAVNLVSFTVNKTATTTGITTELLTSVANNFS